MKRFYYVFIVLMLAGCGANTSVTGQLNAVPVDSRLKFEKICELDENLNFMGSSVYNLEFIDDEHFYIITNEPSRLILYNTKGEQLKEINRTGKGEGEYIQIGSFHEKDDKQYLWCNMTMKMNIYDKDGGIISSFLSKVNAYDFINYKDLFVFYDYYNYEKYILSVCNTNGDLLKGVDISTQPHVLLNSIAGYPRMLLRDSLLYYIHTNKLSLFELNLNDYSVKSYPIEDDNFVVRDVSKEETSARRFSVFNYVFTNSSVNGLLEYKNYFIIKTELGHSTIVDNEIKDNSSRYAVFYLLNDDKKLKERIVFNISEYYKFISGLSSYKKQLYTLKLEKKGTENEKYVLYKIDLTF